MTYETLRVRSQGPVTFVQLDRPLQNNAINARLIDECTHALDTLPEDTGVVVLEGRADVFCVGADFAEISASGEAGVPEADPARLYALWYRLASGPFCSVAHVRGKVNAGGVGFVAACDVVIAQTSAEFALSELLFGLFPACVLPFLSRRIGAAKANYFTLLTRSIGAAQARDWGLVDEVADNSEELLRLHLLRLRRLNPRKLGAYKAYMRELDPSLAQAQSSAISANRAMFRDPNTLNDIRRFVASGRFPWD
jgi:polyketide biosynthesis enoyl-CoA hydratase PksH